MPFSYRRALYAAPILLALSHQVVHAKPDKQAYFERIASFPVYLNTDINAETVAEIVAASENGKTLIYTDSETEKAGFVDLSNPHDPKPLGTIDLNGEPTSVAVAGKYALVAVNRSADFINTAGELVVIDINQQQIVATLPLGGQPDSVAVSHDQRFAAIAIENERDEDLGNGEPPQMPAGFLTIVDLKGPPKQWTLRDTQLTGLADLFPQDPEPEYVSINKQNVAAITLQENNHIVLVDLASGQVIDHFSAGSADLSQIDINENDLIEPTGSLSDVPREPDGITWINRQILATADEGDLFGGSRGFSIFNRKGKLLHSSGSQNDHLAMRVGHYPENRSENKGNEPENVAVANYGKEKLLFVGSERANLIFVYELDKQARKPKFKQLLPTGVGPEGLLPIPQRNLFVAAAENDDRGDKFRSVLGIYKLERSDQPTYPTIRSRKRSDGTPIPWGALSGLAVDQHQRGVFYSVHDSFYQQSRIYSMANRHPATITAETIIHDSLGALGQVEPSLVNADATVNLDLEGIAQRADGGFWVVSEGIGTVGDSSRPVESQNLLLQVAADGAIEAVHTLPESTNARQIRFGFEGVAVSGRGADETVFVAFQREWADDPANRVRIGRLDLATGEWSFYYYPLEIPTSPNGGWVGLSEITHLGDDRFAVIERDNQGGPDATIKRIYEFSIAGLTPTADPAPGITPDFPVVEKRLVRDLMADLQQRGGLVLEKIEGLAVTPRGTALVVNDNDGVDDSNGETQLIRIKGLF
ncbi:MAG TPA: alkaline phosphatase [Gammaproteobacteria bacterium]|nr:alkaline phosphatase [Gammaproteobacteria bacterium]